MYYTESANSVSVRFADMELNGFDLDTERRVTVSFDLKQDKNMVEGRPRTPNFKSVTYIVRAKPDLFEPAPDNTPLVLAHAFEVLRSTLKNFDQTPFAAAGWCGAAVGHHPVTGQMDSSNPFFNWIDGVLSKIDSSRVEVCVLPERAAGSLQSIASKFLLYWNKHIGSYINGDRLFGHSTRIPIHLIPLSKVPRGKRLHRYSQRNNWKDHRSERLRLIWRGADLVNDESVIAPDSDSDDDDLDLGKQATQRGLSPTLKILLIGSKDVGSPFSKLPLHLIKRIYLEYRGWVRRHLLNSQPGVYASIVGKVVSWPPFTGLNINMMPIRLGDLDSLPASCKPYAPILASLPLSRSNYTVGGKDEAYITGGKAKVGFLTIHESIIEEDGASQRRGGVHTETPGRIWLNKQDGTLASSVKGELAIMDRCPMTVAWGCGHWSAPWGSHYEYEGGLYMGSNVSGSTRVWGSTQVRCPEDVVGPLGDLEHLRHYLGEGTTLRAGEICWMTDTTPHESLPLPAGTRRQYFRLVTNHVNVWYADHSDKNPLGVVPDPKHTKIVRGNKFETKVSSHF